MNTPTRVLPVLVISAACGGGGGEPGLPGAEPLECDGPRESRTFRIDHVELPATADETYEAGVDLDGDGTTDNQTGNIYTWLLTLYPDLGDIEVQLDARLVDDVAWVIGIEHCDNEVRVSLGDADGAGEVPAAGIWSPGIGSLDAERGEGFAPIGALADLGATGFDAWHPTFPTGLELQIVGDRASGRLTGAIGPDFARIVAQAVQPYFQAKLDAGEDGWFAEADRDGDGQLTTAEILEATEFQVLTRPDLEDDGLSFGFLIEATALY